MPYQKNLTDYPGLRDSYEFLKGSDGLLIISESFIKAGGGHSIILDGVPVIAKFSIHADGGKMRLPAPTWLDGSGSFPDKPACPTGFNFDDLSTWGTLRLADIPMVESVMTRYQYVASRTATIGMMATAIKTWLYVYGVQTGVLPAPVDGYTIV